MNLLISYFCFVYKILSIYKIFSIYFLEFGDCTHSCFRILIYIITIVVFLLWVIYLCLIFQIVKIVNVVLRLVIVKIIWKPKKPLYNMVEPQGSRLLKLLKIYLFKIQWYLKLLLRKKKKVTYLMLKNFFLCFKICNKTLKDGLHFKFLRIFKRNHKKYVTS